MHAQRRTTLGAFLLLLLACGHVTGYVTDNDDVGDASMLRAMVERMGSGLADSAAADYLPLQTGYDAPSEAMKASLYERGLPSDELSLHEAFDLGGADDLAEALELSARRDLRDRDDFSATRDLRDELSVPRNIRDKIDLSLDRYEDQQAPYGVELSVHPSLRDQEYLHHSHLLGNRITNFQNGMMRIKPSGAGAPSATSERKTDGVLPAYCNPPNPCPLGYTASDGCLEEFQNTAAFSRNYQAMQECMCDTEHMFDCPDTTRDTEIGALARSIQNEGVLDTTIDKIVNEMRRNPYMSGEKLPVAAKKGSTLP